LRITVPLHNEIDISVVVPIYNSKKYLKECIDSLLQQKNISMEIICVDDSSTDDSLSMIREYARENNCIRIIELEDNHGQAYARNVGLSNALGKYVFFMDSDDYISDSDALSKLLTIANRVNTDCLIFDAKRQYESIEQRNKFKDHVNITENIDGGSYIGIDFFTLLVNNGKSIVTVWRQFWNRQFLLDSGVSFRIDTSPHEDLIFWLESMLVSRIYYLKESFYTYRVREDSSSMRKYNKRRLLAHYNCIFYTRKVIESLELENKYLCILKVWISDIIRILDENYISVIQNGEDINDIYFDDSIRYIDYHMILMRKYPYLNRIFTPVEYKNLCIAEKIIIYGAGKAGRNIYNMLQDFGLKNIDFEEGLTDLTVLKQ